MLWKQRDSLNNHPYRSNSIAVLFKTALLQSCHGDFSPCLPKIQSINSKTLSFWSVFAMVLGGIPNWEKIGWIWFNIWPLILWRVPPGHFFSLLLALFTWTSTQVICFLWKRFQLDLYRHKMPIYHSLVAIKPIKWRQKRKGQFGSDLIQKSMS